MACASGYGAGASGARSGFAIISLPLLIAVAVALIADFDRPRGGLIGISQQPLLDFKQSLRSGQPQASDPQAWPPGEEAASTEVA